MDTISDKGPTTADCTMTSEVRTSLSHVSSRATFHEGIMTNTTASSETFTMQRSKIYNKRDKSKVTTESFDISSYGSISSAPDLTFTKPSEIETFQTYTFQQPTTSQTTIDTQVSKKNSFVSISYPKIFPESSETTITRSSESESTEANTSPGLRNSEATMTKSSTSEGTLTNDPEATETYYVRKFTTSETTVTTPVRTKPSYFFTQGALSSDSEGTNTQYPKIDTTEANTTQEVTTSKVLVTTINTAPQLSTLQSATGKPVSTETSDTSAENKVGPTFAPTPSQPNVTHGEKDRSMPDYKGTEEKGSSSGSNNIDRGFAASARSRTINEGMGSQFLAAMKEAHANISSCIRNWFNII